MSSSTIDVGIDLGTTNSAISRLQQGMPFVIPNNDGAPATPSVVRVNKSGTVFIGKKAYDYLVSDPENTVGEFKRWMGTDHVVSFQDSGKRMTAPELSALILQSLRNDLQSQGDTVPAMVITVPAAFELNRAQPRKMPPGWRASNMHHSFKNRSRRPSHMDTGSTSRDGTGWFMTLAVGPLTSPW